MLKHFQYEGGLSAVKRVCLVALVALILATGSAQAREEGWLQLPEVDHIVVRKGQRRMELYDAAGQMVHAFSGLQFGASPRGHKRFQGDERTPEGRYTIDYGNEQSSYYLSLHISYPNAQDAAYAAERGRSPGGLIFIHGQPNRWAGGAMRARVPGDWTDGCIALSNDEMVALWQAVPDGTTIDILP